VQVVYLLVKAVRGGAAAVEIAGPAAEGVHVDHSEATSTAAAPPPHCAFITPETQHKDLGAASHGKIQLQLRGYNGIAGKST
jgi:hypothetical protein